MEPPLVSVITAVRNGAAVLPGCLRSVAAQTLPDVEHLVVDGASTDGTPALLSAGGGRVRWWVSEPDRGTYDAMNKGVAAARGRWLYFLGADDVLADPGVMERVRPYLVDGPDLVLGDVRYPDGRRVRSTLGPRTLLRNTVHHQGAFYAARVFRDWRYDPALRIAGDYELNLRLYLARRPSRRMAELVAVCGDDGASLTRLDDAYRETNLVRRRHLGPLPNAAAAALYAVEFGLYRRVGRGAGVRT